MDVLRVMIVEDDRAVREGLCLIINGTPGYRCSGGFGSVEEALRLQGEPPNVVLLDINLPGIPGSEGVALFREKYPAAQVLMLTVYAEQDKVFESICNGAAGYLLKKTPPARSTSASTPCATTSAASTRNFTLTQSRKQSAKRCGSTSFHNSAGPELKKRMSMRCTAPPAACSLTTLVVPLRFAAPIKSDC